MKVLKKQHLTEAEQEGGGVQCGGRVGDQKKKEPCHLMLFRFNSTKLQQKVETEAYLEGRKMYTVIPSNVIGHSLETAAVK